MMSTCFINKLIKHKMLKNKQVTSNNNSKISLLARKV